VARIPYADIGQPAVQALVSDIAAQRGSLLHLYRMLLHSPPVAAGWLRYFTAIRHECALPGALRELIIMRVAVLNGAAYEAEQHAPIARAEGLTQDQLDQLADWRRSPAFDARQRAVGAFTDAMTREIRVPDDVFAAVRAELDDRLLLEATATIAGYNMVSRVLEALQIHSHDSVTPAG
jgi:AhpD family alkylhydroperoxidase